MSPQQIRFHLLLDEMFPPRKYFLNLNKYHDLKHIKVDYHLQGEIDSKVVSLAKKEKRILISKNVKHMIPLCREKAVSLICVTENIPYEEIDSKLMAFLKKRKNQDVFVGNLSRSPRKS